MTYGHLNEEQAAVVASFVDARTVMDLGAGCLTLSRILIELGAKRVIAVDTSFGRLPEPGITLVKTWFHNLKQRADIMFVSWPVNWPTGICSVIKDAKIVLYLGKNTDGSACGDQEMWAHLRTRNVLSHVPDKRNTLIVYGSEIVSREPLGEERGALSPLEVLWYDDAEYPDSRQDIDG